MEIDKKSQINILICASGSVATIKLIELVGLIRLKLAEHWQPNIKVVLSKAAQHFVTKEQVNAQSSSSGYNIIQAYDDQDEWDAWNKMSDPVLHIDLAKWAHICLIAPASADLIAKISNGICDNLLTCIVRAWDINKPLVYCPAMNVNMYNHPITLKQLHIMQSFGYIKIDPIEKLLACGDYGIGAMASVNSIVLKVIELLRMLPIQCEQIQN